MKGSGEPPRAPAAGFAPPDERREGSAGSATQRVRALARNLALAALPLALQALPPLAMASAWPSSRSRQRAGASGTRCRSPWCWPRRC